MRSFTFELCKVKKKWGYRIPWAINIFPYQLTVRILKAVVSPIIHNVISLKVTQRLIG